MKLRKQPKADCRKKWAGPAGKYNGRSLMHPLHECELLAPHPGKRHACWCGAKKA